MKALHGMVNDRSARGGRKTSGRCGRRGVSLLLCFCMLVSLLSDFGGGMLSSAVDSTGATGNVMSRIADRNTMDTYIEKLLSTDSGSRYAGRVWTDKSVFAYDSENSGNNKILLDMGTDGYDGEVGYTADFATVFSALTSSQVVNEWPPAPIDLVIAIDMSASMAQDTRYPVDSTENSEGIESPNEAYKSGVLMIKRMQNSRIQETLDAVNNTIDMLMAQNQENRVAVICYGAGATVLMPLSHYKRTSEKEPYLRLGGMETLYNKDELVCKNGNWIWKMNRDACYTVIAEAFKDDKDNPDFKDTVPFTRTVSNNVDNHDPKEIDGYKEQVVANPGYASWDGLLSDGKLKEGSLEFDPKHEELQADVYVGYSTNTQGGIYLAYAQLARETTTTFTGELSTGEKITVARVPSVIIMTDGGANFAFNEMTEGYWGKYYGAFSTKHNVKLESGTYELQGYDLGYNGGTGEEPYFRTDDSSYDHKLGYNLWETGHDDTDMSHRMSYYYEDQETGAISEQAGDEWYKVYLPGEFMDKEGDKNKITSLYNHGMVYSVETPESEKQGRLTTIGGWDAAGVFYNSENWVFGTSGTVLEVLLTASYMRYVADTHYERGWDAGKATKDSRTNLLTFTMSVDSKNIPQWGKLRLYPTLDPAHYSIESYESWCNEEEKFGSDEGILGSYTKSAIFSGLKASWDKWKSGQNAAAVMQLPENPIAIRPLPEEGYIDPLFDNITVTNDDVIANINYSNEFFDVETADMSNRFAQILSEIVGSVFIPVSGDNDAGVGDSVTYQDPLGEYMELKNQSILAKTHLDEEAGKEEAKASVYDMALLLFGEMHGLVRAGVYDYQWNDQWMATHGKKTGVEKFPIGWYKGEPKDAYQPYKDSYGGTPGTGTWPAEDPVTGKKYASAVDAWADGWVMRFDFQTLLDFVPIADAPEDGLPNDLSEQVKHTVYTCYRFAGSQESRNRLRMNPIYGTEVPDELQKIWDAARDAEGTWPVGMDLYKGYPGVYRLSDIRVWEEHTGDFVDEKGAITPEAQSGYDDSLYVNIPVSAVPTQLAEITLGPSGPISYKTNLGEDHKADPAKKVEEKTEGEEGYEDYLKYCKYLEYCNYCSQSTPFRLFYAVGLSEDLIQRDADGKQTGIDVSKISGEYISSHSDPETNNIYFVSNWYSNTTYTGYIGDEEGTNRTRGDAAVSFSPDAANRYYLFQKPLPLFAHAYRVQDMDGNITPVDNNVENTPWDSNRAGNSKTKWENGESPAAWSGGEFVGTYTSKSAFKEALQNAQSAAPIGGVRYIKDEKGRSYPLPADITKAVITLQEDQLDKVESEKDGRYTSDSVSFSSDDYFFLCIEYYVPTGGTGKDINGNDVAGTQAVRKVSHMIARKGSAFGSGLHSENIGNGDMLCWSDINGNCTIEIEYNSRTETGDNTRGEPTFEKLTCPDEKLREVLEKCGLKTDDTVTWTENGEEKTGSSLDRDVAYWKSVRNDPYMKELIEQIKAAKAEDYQEDPSVVTDEDAQKKKYAELFDWSVSARTGGIRVGDMFNNVQPKLTEEESKNGNPTLDSSSGYYAGNVTHTSNNYYVPTLSETSTAGAGMVINNYLGNNGRLEIANSSLMVTKTLVAPDGFTLTKEQDNTAFAYQVFIDGVTGLRSAQRLKFNPLSGTWQKRIESLDILTDNSSLLLASGGGRALFYFDKAAPKGTLPRQVIEVLEGTETKYYFADENGNATADPLIPAGTDSLYYLYLPSNAAGELSYRLFGATYDGGTEKIDDAGTTAYCDDLSKYGDLKDPEKQQYVEQANGKLTAGSREYWTTAAVLIPYQEVQDAEHPANGALDESGGLGGGTAGPSMDAVDGEGQWSYSASNEANYQKLNKDNGFSRGFTLVTVIPDPDGTDSTVWSPYSSRTQYMTEDLYFGYKRDSVEGLIATGKTLDDIDAEALKNCELKGTDLYDPVVPNADRPDLFGNVKESDGLEKPIDNAYIAKNTAEFSLKSGEGLLFTGLGNRIVYRFTEKISEEQMKKGFTLKEISHIQQRGSESIYRPGVQQIPIYSKTDATYGREYGSASEKKTENGLTWQQSDLTPQNEPFAHTNAIMWEYYATMAAGASGNHHQPLSVTAEQEANMQIWDGKHPNTYEPISESHTVKTNPNCNAVNSKTELAEGSCDLRQGDSFLHYMYYQGKLIDPHYEGEASTYLRNMARYGVSPTVRFGVVGEDGTQDPKVPATNAPEDGYYDYSGVYSTFGNTGYFAEQVHYTNTVSPEMLVLEKTVVNKDGEALNPQPDLDFTFKVEFTAPENPAMVYEDTDPSQEATSKHKLYIWEGLIDDLGKAPKLDEYLDFIGKGLTEIDLKPSGTKDTYTATVKAGHAIVFYGLLPGTTYTITEEKDERYPAVNPETHKTTGEEDGVGEAYYTQKGTVERNLDDASVDMKPSETENRAHFYDKTETGVLTVEKKIDADAESIDPNAEFTFNVTLRPKEGETLQEKDLTVKKVKTAADGTETNGTFGSDEGKWTKDDDTGALTATFKLKHGERITIEGIPLDTSYTVEEPASGRKGYTLAGVAASAKDLDGTTTPAFDRTTSSVSGTVTLKDIQAYLLFVNQPTTLTVEKKVLDESADPDLSFTFNVTLTPAGGESLDETKLKAVKMTKAPDGTEKVDESFTGLSWDPAADGRGLTAEFTLKHGEKIVITGIPVGTTYTVQEPVENIEEGYTLEHVADNPDDTGLYLKINRTDNSVTGTLTETEKAAQAYLLFANNKTMMLPVSGGIGVGAYWLAGAALVLLFCVLGIGYRRKYGR